MNKFADSCEQILAGFETLRGQSHVPGEYLSFRIGLYRAQLAAYHDLNLGSPPSLPLQPGSIVFDPAILARIITETARSLDENRQLKIKLEKLAGDSDKLVEVADASAFGPDLQALERLSLETGNTRDELLFFGRAIAAPYVSRIIATAGENTVPISPEASLCPYCGSEPGLSLIRGDAGQRFLICSLCGLEWGFSRTRCPFCDADSSLEIITEGADAPRWIESCARCKGYLKMVDQRRLGITELIPLLEVMQTLYLDFIAAKEGCQPGLPYVAIK